jgi:hypothetical protein
LFLKNGPIQDIQAFDRDGPYIFPNPAANFISFGNIPGSNIKEIAVFNLSGQLIKKEVSFPAKERFDVSDLPRGVYLVQLLSLNKKYLLKLVLTK